MAYIALWALVPAATSQWRMDDGPEDRNLKFPAQFRWMFKRGMVISFTVFYTWIPEHHWTDATFHLLALLGNAAEAIVLNTVTAGAYAWAVYRRSDEIYFSTSP